jgi:hypothetical protein
MGFDVRGEYAREALACEGRGARGAGRSLSKCEAFAKANKQKACRGDHAEGSSTQLRVQLI